MSAFNPAVMLALAPKLGELLKAAFEQYVVLRAAGLEVDANVLASFIEQRAQGWDPVVGGKHVLDVETRAAGCRFLGGIVFNMASSVHSPVNERAGVHP